IARIAIAFIDVRRGNLVAVEIEVDAAFRFATYATTQPFDEKDARRFDIAYGKGKMKAGTLHGVSLMLMVLRSCLAAFILPARASRAVRAAPREASPRV